MDHAQREQSLLLVFGAFTKGTTLKEVPLIYSANDQLSPFNLAFTLCDQATCG